MDLMALYNKIKKATIKFANTNNHPDIYSVNSSKSNGLSCSASTKNSENKSVTSIKIPTTVSVQTDNIQ